MLTECSLSQSRKWFHTCKPSLHQSYVTINKGIPNCHQSSICLWIKYILEALQTAEYRILDLGDEKLWNSCMSLTCCWQFLSCLERCQAWLDNFLLKHQLLHYHLLASLVSAVALPSFPRDFMLSDRSGNNIHTHNFMFCIKYGLRVVNHSPHKISLSYFEKAVKRRGMFLLY